MKTIYREDHNEEALDLCPDCGKDRPGCECRMLPCGCLWVPGDCPTHAAAPAMREALKTLADAAEDCAESLAEVASSPQANADVGLTQRRVTEARALLRAMEGKP